MTEPASEAYHPAPIQASRAGRIAMIFGIVVIAISAVQQVVIRFVPFLMNQFAAGSAEVGIAFALGSIVVGVFALLAVIFGAFALRGKGPDAPIGGVGFGIGLITLVNVIVGLLSAPLTALILG